MLRCRTYVSIKAFPFVVGIGILVRLAAPIPCSQRAGPGRARPDGDITNCCPAGLGDSIDVCSRA